jgi:hypothetical protein
LVSQACRPQVRWLKSAPIAVFANAVDDHVEPASHDAREVLTLVVDRRCAQLSNERRVLAARGAPQFETGQSPEHEQRLSNGASGAVHEQALASLDPGRAVQKLVRGRPAQDQRGRLRRVDAHRHTGHVVRTEGTVIGVRPDHRHVSHAVANLKVAHAIAELIDFPDDIVAHYERWPEAHRLGVQMAPNQHLGVIEARGEHSHPHLPPAGSRWGSVDHL